MEPAYIDESQIGGTGSGKPYILTASFAYGADIADVRDELRGCLPRGAKKVHWKEATDQQQEHFVEVVAALPLIHLVVVREDTSREPGERSRRACIEMLFYELSQMDVGHATFESRGRADDALDVKMIQALRKKQIVSHSFRIAHQPGPAEPLLWVADIVNGAVGTTLATGDRHGLEHQAWIRSTNQNYG